MTCLVYICSLTAELHSSRGLVEKDKNPRATHICAYDTACVTLTEKSGSNAAQWANRLTVCMALLGLICLHASLCHHTLSQRSETPNSHRTKLQAKCV